MIGWKLLKNLKVLGITDIGNESIVIILESIFNNTL